MGWLQRIFGRRKKRNQERSMEEVLGEAQNAPHKRSDASLDLSSYANIDKRSEIVSCCERIMEHMNTMKDEKNEYDVVTGYLKDTQAIDEIPAEEHKEIEMTAAKILQFSKQREGILNQKQRLPESRISDFQAKADDIPDQINRLKSNEAYQSVVKRDMQYLEGEKHSWVIELDKSRREQKLLTRALIVAFVMFVLWVIACIAISVNTKYDMTLFSVIVSALIATLAFVSFLRLQQCQKNQKIAEASLNKSIILLNQMKAKYVSITNAVDYVYDKYEIHTAYELEYLWEQYQLAIKEREAAEHANDQVEYFKRVLVRQLRKYHLSDAGIWMNQPLALCDPREMVEVRHRMVEQRQKIRARMENEIEEIKQERDNLNLLIKGDTSVNPDLMKIVRSVDNFCKQYE